MSFIQKNLLYIIPAILAIVTLAYISLVVLPSDNSANREVPIVGNQKIENENASLVFSYPGSETGLTLIEPPVSVGGMLKDAYILTPTREYISWQSSTTPSGTEAPASINLLVFNQPEEPESTATDAPSRSREERLRAWASANDQLTSFNRATSDVENVSIDGLDMLAYSADGLYRQDIYLGWYSGNIYMFVGQYNGNDDPIRQMFTDVLKTIKFE